MFIPYVASASWQRIAVFPVHMCNQEKLSTTQCKYFKKEIKTNVKLCNKFLTRGDLNICYEAEAYVVYYFFNGLVVSMKVTINSF